MVNDAIREALTPHRTRTIRAFLRRCGEEEEAAFWDAVHDQAKDVDHATASAVVAELEASERTVEELLAGWRPESLR